uniref:Trimeric intracellular cation channel type A n=1 Tax=Neolamprologus brichardi TaxID=32507 RepID=A0A3Q4M9D0_NEOBR
MDVLTVLNLGDIAQAFSKMGMFPVFDLAYYIVSILYLKYEPGSVEVSRRSPVASWLCAMLYCFGSYILADIMLGSCPVDYFQHNSHILLASAVWIWSGSHTRDQRDPQHVIVSLGGKYNDQCLLKHKT